MNPFPRSLLFFLALSGLLLAGCSQGGNLPAEPKTRSPVATAAVSGPPSACPVTRPFWLKPPEDSAVLSEPAFGYYYANADRSMLASAWWSDQRGNQLRAGEDKGIKMGWFRPAGAELTIIGRRLDGDAPALHSDVPCCYPTRFQASGVAFPTEGCWEVTGRAAESELTFVVWVDP